jgi:hypothetical protein
MFSLEGLRGWMTKVAIDGGTEQTCSILPRRLRHFATTGEGWPNVQWWLAQARSLLLHRLLIVSPLHLNVRPTRSDLMLSRGHRRAG